MTVWQLENPQVQMVGQVVDIVHLHLSSGTPSVLHVGYAIGRMESGAFVAEKTQTKVFPLDRIATEFPQQGPAVRAAAKTLLEAAYAVLHESGAIGPGAVQ